MSVGEAERLLGSNPSAAESWARSFLTGDPNNIGALVLLGAALRRQGKLADARSVLEPVTELQPDSIIAHFELGLTLGRLDERQEGIRALRRAVDLRPEFANAWFALAEQLQLLQHQGTLLHRPPEVDAGFQESESAVRTRRYADAEVLLANCLLLDPDFETARFLLSIVLLAQEKGREALPFIETLIAGDHGNSIYPDLRAAALFQAGEFAQAIAQYEDILKGAPDRPGAWMAYGRALRALGRREQCLCAYKRAIALLPGWVEAYRILASVKTYRFESAEIDVLRTQLARSGLPAASYAELHFALGKVLEDAGQYGESFENYANSAALQRANIAYSADASTKFLRREMTFFTAALFRELAGAGCQSAAPIFVVGMPRAGSTLVQELLCAHSAIERTGELRYLTWMTAGLGKEKNSGGAVLRYPDVLRTFDKGRFAALGEEYLRRTLSNRKFGRPFFVDKYPGNFVWAGLIHLILPNAKIVDVRRHPLDCCLSCFKNYFPEGPLFSHDLNELGRYYADYVELMAHYEDVLPGKIHRVFYEQLVENPEREVRSLLDYLDLPFERACLRFYEKEQAILTTSTEQVRLPIYRTGVGTWQNYDEWIGPLKCALGDVLETYPAAPKAHFHARDRQDNAASLTRWGSRYRSPGLNYVVKYHP